VHCVSALVLVILRFRLIEIFLIIIIIITPQKLEI